MTAFQESGKFKCCEKLFSSYYVCTQCHEIIHRNCVTNGKYKGTLNIIKGNKVNCCNNESVDLEKSTNLLEEKNAALEETLNELSLDTQLKSTYIEKLKRENDHLLNEASMREDELNKIIVTNEKTISELNESIIRLKLDLKKYTDKIYNSNSTQTEIRVRNASTNTEESTPLEFARNESVLGTISTSLQSALPPAGPTSGVLTDSIDEPIDLRSPSIQEPIHSLNTSKLRNVLVLSDNFGYNLNYLLNTKLSPLDYRVQCIYKPGAKFENIIENIECLSRNLTLRDHIVIVGGSNNFSSSFDYPKFKVLWKKLKLCPNTNFTFVGVPYGYHSQNGLIHKFNKNFNRFVSKLNSCLPGLYSFIDVNVGSGTISKKKLRNLIHDTIMLGKNPLPKNLILINPNTELHFNSTPSNQNIFLPNVQPLRTSETDVVITTESDITVRQDSEVIKSVTYTLGANTTNTATATNIQSNFLYPRLSQMSQI